ncbi:HAD family hydrolase [Rhizomonospora bruguierae]|uniref:HAD family hydrolase n=1 Tax=Rhizomonospora bruguierae TaxID=1581705 RepID=UPI0020BEABBD|nr:HAD-IA family hydrolase [Micromonospora sp. NBRC 107566]
MTSGERPSALLVDLDGVLRRWDPAAPTDIEHRHGLPPGLLMETAMQPHRLIPTITGRITHDAWAAGVAEALTGITGDSGGAKAAVAEWVESGVSGAEVDRAVLDLLRQARAAGRPVGLATNATDRLDADLAALGLTGELDAVVNSSVVGEAKPSPGYFAAACAALGLPPAQVLFVDDSDRAVRGARAAGLYAHRWSGPADLPYLRAALGL